MSSPFVAPTRFDIDEILARNETYATTKHKALPPLTSLLGGNIKVNGPHVVVVSCMDSRCNPYEVLGFKPYEIISLRNPSGRITPFLTDLPAIDTVFGINQIIILHHSNCGTTHFEVDQEIEDVRAKCPDVSEAEIEELVRLSPARKDTDDALKLDVATLKECRFVREELRGNVVGLYLDVKTGVARSV